MEEDSPMILRKFIAEYSGKPEAVTQLKKRIQSRRASLTGTEHLVDKNTLENKRIGLTLGKFSATLSKVH
jgi:hypothetical protein